MKGFRDFVMRGNLVELAVAFIMGAAFATVVTAFTKLVIEILAKAGGSANFDKWQPGGLVTFGPFLTALVAFVILALVVYFFIVKPYEAMRARFSGPAEAPGPDEVALLTEIRDELRARRI